MMNILFPTDFTEASKSAEKYAIELARLKEAKLALLYVESEHEERTEAASIQAEEQEHGDIKIEKIAYVKLQEIIKSNNFEEDPHTLLVKVGEVTETILQSVEELDIQLIVMGSHGNENYERYNSNATKIIRQVRCSVLTVPHVAEHKKVKEIVYATDLIHKDEQAFKQLVKFAKAYDAHITLLHINIDGKDVPGRAPLKSIPEIMSSIDYEKLDSEVIVSSSVMEGFEKYAKENSVDVLAMTSHSNTLLERFFRDTKIEKMVLSSTIPVLTFPE